MPYEVSFTRKVPIRDRKQYLNECCVGGDAVIDLLLPVVREKYADIQTEQEDWGWFIWFRKGQVKLAIDVFTDDPETGAFRIHLTSRARRLLRLESVVDTPELEELRALVAETLTPWAEGPVVVERLDSD